MEREQMELAPVMAGLYGVAPIHGQVLLRQSLASVLVNKSPLHCWHKAFGGAEEEYTDATDRGELAHALLLGGKEIVSVEANDWRTNAAKEQRDAARMAGKIPVLTHKLAEALPLVERVREFMKHRGLELDGKSELTMIWQSPGGVWCQGRCDHWLLKQRTILDFKFVRSAHPDYCGRSMVDYGYHIQDAAYTQAFETLYPDLAGRLTFLLVFIEKDAPHAITIGKSDGEMRTLGISHWERACDEWQSNLEAFGPKIPWPAYSTEIVRLKPPAWAIARDIERFEEMEREESNAVSGARE